MYPNHTPSTGSASRKFARTSDGTVNAVIEGDVFTRPVNRKRHFVWKYRGYGLNADEAESLPAQGVQWMRFNEKDTGATYTISVSDFLSHGIRDRLGDCEFQIFCPVEFMDEVKPLNIASKALKAGESRYKRGAKTAKQLSLFGGQ